MKRFTVLLAIPVFLAGWLWGAQRAESIPRPFGAVDCAAREVGSTSRKLGELIDAVRTQGLVLELPSVNAVILYCVDWNQPLPIGLRIKPGKKG